jgi:hypothetical protein
MDSAEMKFVGISIGVPIEIEILTYFGEKCVKKFDIDNEIRSENRNSFIGIEIPMSESKFKYRNRNCDVVIKIPMSESKFQFRHKNRYRSFGN